MRIRERVRYAGAVMVLVLIVGVLSGCSWRPDRNAAQVNLKAVKSIGRDLVKYVDADKALDKDAKRIKRTKVGRAIKHAEKLLEVSR